MRRRDVLGSLAVMVAAGCTGSKSTPATTTRSDTTATTATTAASSTTTTSAEATPSELRTLGVPVEQSGCPVRGDQVERVVCYPEQTGAPLALTPAADTLALPTAETTFTLANDTDYEFRTNFHDWKLHKRVDDEWYFVTPRLIPAPLHVLPGGETHEWTVTIDNTRKPSTGPADDEAITIASLGGGEYAFSVTGYFRFDDHEHRIGLGARFALDGPQIELTKPADTTGTRDGNTVVVTRDDADGDPTDALVVERLESGGVPPNQPIHDHIAEQLVRPMPVADRPLLGNALAFFEEGVDVVRIESTTELDPRFDRDEHYYFSYRGTVYEAKVESIE